MIAAARTEASKETTKEPTRRILQRRICKEQRYPAPKTQRHGNWEPSRVGEILDDTETMDERVEVVDAISENEKAETSKPDASPKPKDKKSKVLTHLRNSIDPGEIAQRIF